MKKVLNVIKNIFVWLIVAIAVGMMIFTIFSVNTFDQNNRSIFGYKFYTVKTDSMSATDFDAGDIIFVKEVDPYTLKEGDIIAYLSQNEVSYGETVTHKIRRLTVTEDGQRAFITYGTTTDTDDEMPVTYPYVLGKYTGKVPNVGTFFMFLKQPQGYIICIFIPFLLLILYQGINCIRLFRQYKKEQMEEINAERARIEEERQKSMEMMQELQALRQELAGKKTEPETKTDSPQAEETDASEEASEEADPDKECSENTNTAEQ